MPVIETGTGAPSRSARSDPLRLMVIGAGILAAAFLALVAVGVTQTDGYDWPDESVVPVDGEAHTVAVSDHRDVMLWTEGGTTAVDCTVADATSGAPLAAEPIDGSYRRPGKVSEWVGTITVAPESSAVSVTCAGVSPTFVGVQSVPRVPAFLSGFSAWFLVPALVAVAGVGWLGAGLLVAGRRRRHC